MSIGYPQQPMYMREEAIPSTLNMQKSGVALQLQQLEHLLNVQEEMLGTLNARLNDVLRPVNVPVNTAREERETTGTSLLVDMLSVLAKRVELHNQRLGYTIDSVDL